MKLIISNRVSVMQNIVNAHLAKLNDFELAALFNNHIRGHNEDVFLSVYRDRHENPGTFTVITGDEK